MLKTLEMKLYLTDAQERTLSDWLRTCCWLYNHALAQRAKAYKRRGQSISFQSQTAWLTKARKRSPALESVPFDFARDGALKRVDRSMQAFFRRVKAGEKPGYPRFKSVSRFNSLERVQPDKYVRSGNLVYIPKLGLVKMRAGNRAIPKTQRLLRIVRRASGWFAQVLIEDGKATPPPRPIQSSVGVDVGLSSFATMSDGKAIPNPRFLDRSARRLRHLQRRASRRIKGSRKRRKAITVLARQHERVAAQRKNFCHKHSTDLVRRYDLIAVENLNIKGLARTRMARSVHDASWAIFLNQLRIKAANAGCTFVEVDARYTSQTCPQCGNIKPKELSERTHECSACGLRCDRDHAAARVILSRAEVNRRVTLAEAETRVDGNIHEVSPLTREEPSVS